MRRRVVSRVLSALLGGAIFLPALAGQARGVDLKGSSMASLAGPQDKVVVLIFAASDCPISNRYVPEIERLHGEFAPRGVRIWWVFPNPGDTAAVVTKHTREFSINVPTLVDAQQGLVKLAGAAFTPQAAVFERNGDSLREVYKGRIDDRYLALGQERPAPQHHELEAAIAAALDGKPVPQPAGPPVGCSIVPAHP